LKTQEYQVGPRVDAATIDALKRLAAVAGLSVGKFTAKVLKDYVAKQQAGEGGLEIEDILGRLERRIGAMHEAERKHFEVSIKRVEKGLLAVRAMIDAHVEAHDPQHYAEYRQAAEGKMRALGMEPSQPLNGKGS
jgi:hypothetical protein